LYAPGIQDHEKDDEKDDKAHLVMVKAHGKKTEEGIGAGDEGDGDGEHIVDEEGAARYDARLFAYGVGRHDVPASSVGEVLDDPGVSVGNDKDGKRRGEGEKDGEIGVSP